MHFRNVSKDTKPEFADGRNDIYKEEVAKKQKVTRQKANSSAVEANSIHRMSVSMAKNTNSNVLKDHMAMFIQDKDFFSDDLQKEIAANLGKSLLVQTSINASRTSQDIAGPVELLESDCKLEEEMEDEVEVVDVSARTPEREAVKPDAPGEENSTSDMKTKLGIMSAKVLVAINMFRDGDDACFPLSSRSTTTISFLFIHCRSRRPMTDTHLHAIATVPWNNHFGK